LLIVPQADALKAYTIEYLFRVSGGEGGKTGSRFLPELFGQRRLGAVEVRIPPPANDATLCPG
jgi:hypothetical protein